MNSIYEKVIQQQVLLAMEASKKRESDKPKYEYDSDEETDGGTWEHKKRHQEMMKTLGMSNKKFFALMFFCYL